MPTKRLKEYLDDHKVKYETIPHANAYTAQETAALSHVSGKEMAKTVVVKLDGKMTLSVLPASYRVDFNLLKKNTGANRAELVSENEFTDLFPECEVGAMPPFGNLYGMDVYVAKTLAEDKEIVFNAGTHTELVKISFKDFEQLVKPKVVRFSRL
ncbi:YbaK/EbsC family protein [bacterium]|nr:YbaK/EbsC family protein [bacterium]